MKRTSFFILLMIVSALAGCTTKTYTPVLQTEFDVIAVYKTGDFSYKARIRRNEKGVFVTPLTTNAAGMTISCDGKTVTFSQGAFCKSFDKNRLDATNPAVVLDGIFACLESQENGSAVCKDGEFVMRGKTSAGAFTLVQTKTGRLKSVSVPDAAIEILFEG